MFQKGPSALGALGYRKSGTRGAEWDGGAADDDDRLHLGAQVLIAAVGAGSRPRLRCRGRL